ncbi:ribonuclease P protein component [Lutimaribacter sp. EGI FJ00015]|uniref:Ribonuclease P protein component n=1 Tax=Lutimaribacter degradans TaxID=2945989 RepID=A0ACC5ZZQ7_9RHOB|nr:ribonuclease P protein component [Lutimaribacter sp. EGI FJ00013]MCM2563241.1 ribonuclease P protein component [Lutimaribacter sp. EGI FJ00013]MCO0614436.1 ribonuclease P protein component [Lutimaribacter sp. EGI FJ00015]MCO0635963.1 ribonuclease P protein component [Lutimaribacter sp. EGI FJ00014]
MTPPEAPRDAKPPQGNTPPAASVCPDHGPVDKSGLVTLKKRADFLRAAQARKRGVGSMMVQARDRRDGTQAIRVGFTCSKKVGNAVARNRAKRRMRAAARAVLPLHGRPGWDYVLIGRAQETAQRPFELLKRDLVFGLSKLHGDT